jgi:hypothetical protein
VLKELPSQFALQYSHTGQPYRSGEVATRALAAGACYYPS